MRLVDPDQADAGDGQYGSSNEGVVPVLRVIAENTLEVIGTGFFLTPHGLFASAAHVLETFADPERRRPTHRGYVLQIAPGNRNHMYRRRLQHISLSNDTDVAVGQAEVGVNERGEVQVNRRAVLLGSIPPVGTQMTTFAYPENERLGPDGLRVLRVAQYSGVLLEVLKRHPVLNCPCYVTDMPMPHGTSGGPVCDESGRVVGINTRGLNLIPEEAEKGEISFVLPIALILGIHAEGLQIPEDFLQRHPVAGSSRPRDVWPIGDLVNAGHIQMEFDSPARPTAAADADAQN